MVTLLFPRAFDRTAGAGLTAIYIQATGNSFKFKTRVVNMSFSAPPTRSAGLTIKPQDALPSIVKHLGLSYLNTYLAR